MSATDWRKAGRDAAHEDATSEDATPCTTLDDARLRCAGWLSGVEGADVEAAAEGYLAGWAAHLRDAAGSAAPLDLDAIEARWRDATPGPWRATQIKGLGPVNLIVSDHPSAAWYCVVAVGHNAGGGAALDAIAAARTDVPALVARVRDLTAKLDASEASAAAWVETSARLDKEHHEAVTRADRYLRERDAVAQAFDDIVARAWRAATGDDHEGPANVDDLLTTVAALRASHRHRSEALLTMTRRALDAERLLDATEGTEREEELARQIRATARREGAEAMREACIEAVEFGMPRNNHEAAPVRDALAAINDLPLPEGAEAGTRNTASYHAGAEAMREECVEALEAMAHAEGVDAERFRLTRGEDSATEHHHKRAALLEARVTVLGLTLPEVTR